MARTKPTDPKNIAEIEALKDDGYTVEFWQAGTWLVDGWLFLYPKDQKYGERYRQVYGYYESGKLKDFVATAMQNKFEKKKIFYGKDHLNHKALI
jgi:hypothetical protein